MDILVRMSLTNFNGTLVFSGFVLFGLIYIGLVFTNCILYFSSIFSVLVFQIKTKLNSFNFLIEIIQK
jgi:hypothetical protein